MHTYPMTVAGVKRELPMICTLVHLFALATQN